MTAECGNQFFVELNLEREHAVVSLRHQCFAFAKGRNRKPLAVCGGLFSLVFCRNFVEVCLCHLDIVSEDIVVCNL